jgi:tripartite-type tricarboxylate transporter receptor subunit TctC
MSTFQTSTGTLPAKLAVVSRRDWLMALAAWASLFPVNAQSKYPDRPIKCIIPNSPGSSVDTIGRTVMTEMSRLLGQAVVLDNRAGAAGAIGVEAARQAQADGYTLLVGSSSAVTVAPFLQKAVPYQPLKDFDLISLMGLLPNVLVCNPALPVNTVTQFLSLAKSKPGQTRMASAGIGSVSHLAGAALQVHGRFESLHVPYRGGSQGVASVVSGETDWVLTPAPAAMALVTAKRLKLLCHSMSAQLHPLGDTAAIASELPGFEFASWIGLMGPRGMPPTTVALLNALMAQALKSEQLNKVLETNGAIARHATPDGFRSFLSHDIDITRSAVQAAGILAE